MSGYATYQASEIESVNTSAFFGTNSSDGADNFRVARHPGNDPLRRQVCLSPLRTAAWYVTDESSIGVAGAGAGLGLTLADATLEGGKVIPALGNALSATIGLYDGYQLAKTIGKCW